MDLDVFFREKDILFTVHYSSVFLSNIQSTIPMHEFAILITYPNYKG